MQIVYLIFGSFFKFINRAERIYIKKYKFILEIFILLRYGFNIITKLVDNKISNKFKDFILMKKALNLLLMFILLSILGLFLGTAFSYVYFNIANYVAGQKLVLFSNRDLLKTLIQVAIYVLIFICPALCFVKIKTRGSVPQTIIYIIICLVVWAGFLPVALSLGERYSFNKSYSVQPSALSGNYFREGDNKVFYFTRDFKSYSFEGGDTNTIVIDTTQEGKVSSEQIPENPDFELFKSAEPYRDILVKNVFKDNSFSIINVSVILQSARSAWGKTKEGKWSFWIGFLSLGLALCSLFFIAEFSDWKLINVTGVLFFAGLIIFCNSIYFSPLLSPFKQRFLRNNQIFGSLNNIFDEPFLVIVNVVFSFVIVMAGVIRIIVKRKK